MYVVYIVVSCTFLHLVQNPCLCVNYNILDQCSCVDRLMEDKLNHICIGPSVPPCTFVGGGFEVTTVQLCIYCNDFLM